METYREGAMAIVIVVLGAIYCTAGFFFGLWYAGVIG
jgi:hypothetical protein